MGGTERDEIVAGGKPHDAISTDVETLASLPVMRRYALQDAGHSPQNCALLVLYHKTIGNIVNIGLEFQCHVKPKGCAGLDYGAVSAVFVENPPCYQARLTSSIA